MQEKFEPFLTPATNPFVEEPKHVFNNGHRMESTAISWGENEFKPMIATTSDDTSVAIWEPFFYN